MNLFTEGRQKTLSRLMIDLASATSPSRNVFFTKTDEKYEGRSIGDLLHGVFDLCERFKEWGLQKGDRVAIISDNRFEWVVVDFACMFYGAVSVPVYPSLSSSQIGYILEASGSKLCFVSNKFMLDKVNEFRKDIPGLSRIISFRSATGENSEDRPENLFELVSLGITEFSGQILKMLEVMSDRIESDDLLTIIYTSGTTGNPKGVMLTHKNLYSNLESCTKVLPIDDNDVFLSFLPYSHSYERTAGYYLALFSGSRIFYAQSIETISAQMPEVKPTIMMTVPRLLDKIYNRLFNSSEEMKDGLKKKLFVRALAMADERTVPKNSLKWKLADALVYKKIREKTGGKLRFFVSGGGALNKKVGEFFDYIGIMSLEGYGLTETSPVISVNPPDRNKYGTVGPPLNGVDVRIAGDGEILVSGDLVMKGYFNDEISTNEVLKNGVLHTGDIGETDSDGYIKITDRKKSLFKTSGGKYVAPGPLEDILLRLPFAETVVVIGDERMYVTALIVPQRNDLLIYAAKNNITFEKYEDLLHNERLHKIIQKEIDSLQTHIPGYEKIKRFKLMSEPFAIESGELTPTMKVKRKFVQEKYAADIDEMYLKV